MQYIKPKSFNFFRNSTTSFWLFYDRDMNVFQELFAFKTAINLCTSSIFNLNIFLRNSKEKYFEIYRSQNIKGKEMFIFFWNVIWWNSQSICFRFNLYHATWTLLMISIHIRIQDNKECYSIIRPMTNLIFK